MSFIPMKLDLSQSTIGQPDSGYAFQLPPMTCTVGFTQVTPNADPRPGRNDLNLSDPSYKLKFHCL
jgi:hypothetical protein